MKTRRHSKGRRTTAGARKRHSNAGQLMPPLDVRSSSHLKDLMKRIKSGPLTIVMVYADWCGHCHAMRPHFDAASKAPGRTVQSVAVNEKMLNQVNQSIHSMNAAAAPLEVDAYPTIMIVDNKGNKVSDIAPEKNTAALTKVMTTPTGPPTPAEMAETEEMPSEEPEFSEPASIGRLNSDKGEDRLLGSNASVKRLKAIEPTAVGGGLRGGTLLSALSQSAYTLAPAAILLATAAQVMKRSKGSKGSKGSKRSTRSAFARRTSRVKRSKSLTRRKRSARR